MIEQYLREDPEDRVQRAVERLPYAKLVKAHKVQDQPKKKPGHTRQHKLRESRQNQGQASSARDSPRPTDVEMHPREPARP